MYFRNMYSGGEKEMNKFLPKPAMLPNIKDNQQLHVEGRACVKC